ncbi:MAG: hypothetical protein CMJ58_22385 [Planctomycetaceae bacterium]|nr:hypothetical protein [Planctomycetaceae bacterium]
MRFCRHVVLALLAVAPVMLAVRAAGQTPTYRVERIASGLRQPVYMDQAPGDPANIIYYMTRTTTGGANAGSGTHGSLWRYDMDTRAATEVLNLSHRDLTLDLGPQGFAFHPDFNNPGTDGYQKIYVSSAATGGPVNYVEEYAASGANGTVPINRSTGEPIVSRTLLQYDNVFGDNNHVIDWIGFDPRAYSAAPGSPERNYLYISAGDGSNGRSAPDRPEQKSNIVQGKLLRIDIDPNKPDFYPGDPQKNFAIPDTNPIPLWNSTHGPTEQLVGTTLTYTTGTTSYTPALPELYFTGTRNTFRMSLDRVTGDFYSGDVGEVQREEINFVRADPYDGSQPPLDFGFPQREGTGNFISQAVGSTTIQWDLSGGGSVVADSINPIQEGDHGTLNAGSTAGDVEIRSTPRSAYIGGYVYRGPVAELQGKYFYADFVQGNIMSLDFDTNIPLENYSGTNLNQQSIPGESDPLARIGTREVVLNRNLNSLWHTIMDDPADPTYTPALGSSFGIGRIVSFGEDNDGNLYVVDMGGQRGNASFLNDYPGTSTGQIFRISPLFAAIDVTLTVNRETGEVTLQNATGAPLELNSYSLLSTAGAIDPASWTPVAGNYDVPNPPGDGSVDDNDSWLVTVSTNGQFSEETTGDKGTIGTGATVSLGEAGSWIQSVYEDWTLQIELADGTTVTGAVEFIGNGDQPFARSDLDFNGVLEPADWLKFRANYFSEFAAQSAAQSYEFGDLDGDGDNDYDDFRLFQSDYVAVHGMAAFVTLTGVPEPSGMMLAIVAGAAVATYRRRRCCGRRAPRAALVALIVGAGVLATAPTQAALQHQYTFFNGSANDSIGTAHGQLFGNAAVSNAGRLELPGGSGDYLGFNPAEIGISSYTDLTFELWFTVDNHQTWARLFDYGDRDIPDNQQGYIYYSPRSGNSGNPALARYATFGDRTNIEHPAPQTGELHHLAFVIDDNANGGADAFSVYLDGALQSSMPHSKSLSDIVETYAYLGKSTFPGDVDPYFDGSIEEFRIYDSVLNLADVQARYAQGPTRMATLVVDIVTGEASIVTSSATPVSFDYYEIRSQGGLLNTTAWNSLDDQNHDQAGTAAGQGWEEADQSSSSKLAEFFLQGSSTVAWGSDLALGRPFDSSILGPGTSGDLTFSIGLPSGELVTGGVEYVTRLAFADFNVDGLVDGADFLAWQRGNGITSGAALADGDAQLDGDVDAADLAVWQSDYGTATFAAAVGQPIPEPVAVGLGAAGLILLAAGRRDAS